MKVSLVLGSGGARGYAHIGVIEEIKRRGHEIVAISGTSMGSVIGGLEAAGKLDDFADWATSLTHLDVFRLYDPAFSQPGVIKADKIFQMVNSFVDNVQIEDLEIPFTAVATDIVNHREVWFQRGDLVTAMRASCALPTFIAPIMVNGKILADGGLVNPVPVEPTSAIPSDVTISVSLSGRPNTILSTSAVNDEHSEKYEEDDGLKLAARLRRGVAGLMDANIFRRDDKESEGADSASSEPSEGAGLLSEEMFGDETKAQLAETESATQVTGEGPAGPLDAWNEVGKLPANLNTMGVVNMALETMQSMIERYRAAANPVNVKIDVPSAVCGTLDFHKASEVIETGRQLAIDAFDDMGL